MAGTVDGVTTGAGGGRAQAIVPLPCAGGGGPVPGGSGGGHGPTPSTTSIPLPYAGPVPPDHVPFYYVSGVPPGAFPGQPVLLVIAFRAQSTDPSRPGSRVFTAPLPCVVTAVSPTTVSLRTANIIPLSMAPPGYSLTVMPALKDIDIPKRMLH